MKRHPRLDRLERRADAVTRKPEEEDLAVIDVSAERLGAIRGILRENSMLEGVGPASSDDEVDAALLAARGAEPGGSA